MWERAGGRAGWGGAGHPPLGLLRGPAHSPQAAQRGRGSRVPGPARLDHGPGIRSLPRAPGSLRREHGRRDWGRLAEPDLEGPRQLRGARPSAPFGRGGSEGARSPSGASAAPRGDPPSQPPTRPDSCPTRSSMSRWHRCKSNQKGPCGSPVTNQVYVSNSLKVSSFRYSNEPSLQALTQQATG